MVRGRTPSFPRNLDFWSQSADSMPSPGLSLGMDTPSAMKVGLNLISATPGFSWSPLLSGLKGSADVLTFPSFAMEDASSPASSNADSGKDVGADMGTTLQLPAWCSEDTMNIDDVDDMLEKKAPSFTPNARPLRKLRHTGKLRKASTATVIDHESESDDDDDAGAASPDLDGGVPTKSTFVDPYLYPTPANRPLRQYLSAPELQSQRYLAAPGNRNISGSMSSSLSMDDFLVEMGWPSSRDAEFGGQGLGVSSMSMSMNASGCEEVEAGPSSISSAGPTLPPSAPAMADNAAAQHPQQQQHQPPFGYTEISGSLYRRRAQTKEGQMPSPTPIHTAAATPTSQRREASQGPSYQQRMTSSVFQPVPAPLMPSSSQSAPLAGLSQQEQQQLDLQRMRLQQLAIQAGANVNIFEDFVAPAQQHAGQESSEKTARAVQAALLYGTDQYARRSSIDALDYSLTSGLVSGSMGAAGEHPAGMDQTLYGGPSVAGPPPPASDAAQTASSQPRWLVYSGGAAPPTMGGAPAVGFTSTYPGGAPGPQPPMAPGRPRKQSMPANLLSRHRASSIGRHAVAGTINPTAAFSGPQLTPGDSVPLMPVYTHAHAHAVPPSAIMGSMAGSSAASMGPWAPSVATMPGSATSATTSHHPSTANSLFSWPPHSAHSADSFSTQGSHGGMHTPHTPPPREASPPQSQSQSGGGSGSGSAKSKAKKVRSTPNFAAAGSSSSSSSMTPTPADASPRKIASNRRVQSSKDLRGDSAERAAAGEASSMGMGMFDLAAMQVSPSGQARTPTKGKKAAAGGVVGGTPSTPAYGTGASTATPGASSTTTPGRPAGFSFVNYGIEDAQELCAAVAPSGSYKIPLKGYGGPGGSGPGAGSAQSRQQQGQAQREHKAPSAAVKTKHRPRAQVDNSLWIQETGEDSGDEEEEEEDDGEADSLHSGSGPGSGSGSGPGSGEGSRSGWGSGSEDELLRAAAGAGAGAEERSKKRPRVRTSTVPSAKQGQGQARQRKKSNNV